MVVPLATSPIGRKMAGVVGGPLVAQETCSVSREQPAQ
jgi:hypothetical protein